MTFLNGFDLNSLVTPAVIAIVGWVLKKGMALLVEAITKLIRTLFETMQEMNTLKAQLKTLIEAAGDIEKLKTNVRENLGDIQKMKKDYDALFEKQRTLEGRLPKEH